MKPEASKSPKPGQALVYDMTSNLCVWSKAGVLQPTFCINAFDCLDCPMDRKMKRDIAQGRLRDGRVLAGRKQFSELPRRKYEEQKCRHMLSGRVSVKYCLNDYECVRCEYHQLILEENLVEPLTRSRQVIVNGFALAHHYYYHNGHTWARVEYGGRVRVGLDDFASRLFGPEEFELPKMGQVVRQGQTEFRLRRGNQEADCLSPLEGIVVAVNPAARGEGESRVADPYDQGWLFVLEPSKLRDGLRNLLFDEESRGWLEADSSRLMSLLAEETGHQLAATGGRAVPDIYGQASELGWDRLRKEFLRSGGVAR
ncbi:MAG: glycine cleavage system protein H [Thermodesulfobacteriota bacterium]